MHFIKSFTLPSALLLSIAILFECITNSVIALNLVVDRPASSLSSSLPLTLSQATPSFKNKQSSCEKPVKQSAHSPTTTAPVSSNICQSTLSPAKKELFRYFHSNSQTNMAFQTNISKINYFDIYKDDKFYETLHGKKIADPFRWLEDANSEQTKKFVHDQNFITEEFIEKCPIRDKLKTLLEKVQNYPKWGCTIKSGNRYYFFKNSGLQNQPVLYCRKSVDDEPSVVIDPNLLSDDGTVAMNCPSFSPKGTYLAYALSYKGSDWMEIRIRNLNTNEDLPEKLTRIKYTNIDWTYDEKGFFYSQYPHMEGIADESGSHQFHQIFYHKLNTDQTKDVLKVKWDNHPKWLVSSQVSDDGKIVHVFPHEDTQHNQWFYADLGSNPENEKLKLVPIYDKFDAEFSYISNNGDTIYFQTNLNAPNYKIAKLDINKPGVENWVDVVPNHPEDVLYSASIYTSNGKDYLVLNYLRKVVHYLEIHELEGKLIKAISTPPGTISTSAGERHQDEFFFKFVSFLTPGVTYQFDLKNMSGPTELFRSMPKDFNSDDFVIKQVFYESNDKTKVPMFIVHHKDTVLDGSNPTILYGYGGFKVQLTSSFNANRIVWLKNMKGIMAYANIRGGGENGETWHESGRLFKKQQCFDDFIQAGEYLIKNNYTNSSLLAIEGGSNGGLLVAAVTNQRPDLFGATICHVGVLDMLRYSKFTIGHAWIKEFGDPDNIDHFDNLLKYSPYHNVPENATKYPATLVLTAEFDDRVVAAHSLKHIARLQTNLAPKLPTTPFLLKVDTKSGHGGGRPLTKQIDETKDIYSFLYISLNLSKYFNE